jgi:hypothetical protein
MNSTKDDRPDERHPAAGAMTGATGSLTPPESDEEFIPAERREVIGPEPSSATETEASDHELPNRRPKQEDRP